MQPSAILGRVPETSKLCLENTGIEVDKESGFIVANQGGEAERTTVPHIYAIGDVLKVSRVYDFRRIYSYQAMCNITIMKIKY